jgi:hypothetical protein
MIRHLKRAVKSGDITVLHDTCEYDSRLEAVLKKSVKVMEGKTPFNAIEFYKCLKPNSQLIHFFKSPYFITYLLSF